MNKEQTIQKLRDLKGILRTTGLIAVSPVIITANYISSSALEKKAFRLELKGLSCKIKYSLTGNDAYITEMNKALDEMHDVSARAIEEKCKRR